MFVSRPRSECVPCPQSENSLLPLFERAARLPSFCGSAFSARVAWLKEPHHKPKPSGSSRSRCVLAAVLVFVASNPRIVFVRLCIVVANKTPPPPPCFTFACVEQFEPGLLTEDKAAKAVKTPKKHS